MTSYLFHNGLLLDPRRDELIDNVEVLVEHDRIKDVSARTIDAPNATRINLQRQTLMPGLIDAHVHVFLTEANFALLESMPLTLLGVKAAAQLRAMLMRGFTTVRDTGGADWGIKVAVDSGLVEGPRIFIAGKALSHTGGNGDVRRRNQILFDDPHCSALYYWSRIVDGVPEMLKAVRDEFRKGADHIKLMLSGGVLQAGSLQNPQFSLDEVTAACQEATNWGSYVCAHAYTSEAVCRAVGSGVRTIEHGNLIDQNAADFMAEKRAFLVPTLIVYDALRRRGQEFGLSRISRKKNESVLEAGLRSLEFAKRAGVEMGYGSDLIGELQDDQSREFLLRADVLRPIEIIRSATIVNAKILKREHELGEIVPGSLADLLVVKGNPIHDLSLLQEQGAHLSAIMKSGQFYKNTLANRQHSNGGEFPRPHFKTPVTIG